MNSHEGSRFKTDSDVNRKSDFKISESSQEETL